MKRLRQSTLDGTPFVERDRLGQTIDRRPRTSAAEYVLSVIGSRVLTNAAWVHRTLDDFVAREARGNLPLELVVSDQRGAPRHAAAWALAKGVPTRVVALDDGYRDRWPRSEFGFLASEKRDRDLVDRADRVLLLWERAPPRQAPIERYADEHGKLARSSHYRKRSDDSNNNNNVT